MLHTSTQQLIRKLCELTDAGAINWREGKGQISLLETEGYVVEIQPEPPSVRLLRNDGQELESADAADLATPWGDAGGTFAEHVAQMARRANRYARGAETAIAKILSSLSAPPKQPPEPEPEPAALAFAAAAEKLAHAIPASESAAAIAAVNADLDSQRRKAAYDPPASHSVADAPAPLILPETDTAIDRVLAVQPPLSVETSKPMPEASEPEAPAAPIEAQSLPIEASPRPAPVLPAPIQSPPDQPPATVTLAPAMAAPPPIAPAASPKAGFGATESFARAQPSRAPPAPQPVATPNPPPAVAAPAFSGLLMRGFSVQSRQTVEPSTTKDFYRSPMANAVVATRPPQPVAAPATIESEPKPEPGTVAGKDVYKPWS